MVFQVSTHHGVAPASIMAWAMVCCIYLLLVTFLGENIICFSIAITETILFSDTNLMIIKINIPQMRMLESDGLITATLLMRLSNNIVIYPILIWWPLYSVHHTKCFY